MSLADPTIFVTENHDGSADITISIDGDDHRFSVSDTDNSHAVVAYDETLSWRAEIRVSEPDESVWRHLMQSDEITDYLESNDFTGIRRDR